MSQLREFLLSSIGRKAFMAATGLLMVVFLLTHVSANLLILFNPGAYNAYSHALISNPLIYVAEFGLIVLFVVHFVNAFILERGNRAARPVAYAHSRPAGHSSRKTIASATMIFSGLVTLAFVPLHLWTFKYGAYYESASEPGVRDLSRLVVEVFENPAMVAWYVVAMVVLGGHTFHGINSAFASLGIAHRSWLCTASRGIACVIFTGFTIIPLALHFLLGGTS